MLKEIWKNIEGVEDYLISNYGIVKSMKLNKINVLKSCVNGSGYFHVHLSCNRKSKLFDIHRLVAKTFIPNPNNKPEVNHKDGNKQNNFVDNLEWVTKSENMLHAYKKGLKISFLKLGENNINSKLLENSVLCIHGLYLSGMNQITISKLYNISNSQVSNIVIGITWNHLIMSKC